MTDMTPDAFERLNVLGAKTREALTDVFAKCGVTGQVTGDGSFFKLYLHDRPITTVQDASWSAEGQQQLAKLKTFLIDGGIFLGGGCFGCLSTATTDAHIEVLCAALTDALGKVSLS